MEAEKKEALVKDEKMKTVEVMSSGLGEEDQMEDEDER